MTIRPAVPGDRDDLYDICVRTGDGGDDARPLFHHHDLLGDIWVGPYLALQPDLAFVAEDDRGVAGYVLGAADTADFETGCEQQWWPAVRARYPSPAAAASDIEAAMIRRVHQPPLTPAGVLAEFPAHLHIDIRPRAQGQGVGRQLIMTLLDALRRRGVQGVHLGVAARNTRAIGFYKHLGFSPVADSSDESSQVLGLQLSLDGLR